MFLLLFLTIALFACNIRVSEYSLYIVYIPQSPVDPHLVKLTLYRHEEAL